MATRHALSSPRAWITVLVLLVILSALALATYTGLEQRAIAAARVESDARRLTRVAASSQKRLVEATRELLIALSEFPEVRRGDPACSARFADLLPRYPHYANVGAARADGTLFCSGLPAGTGINLADRRYVRHALETRDFTPGEYQIDRVSGKPTVSFGYPVVDATGRVQAVVFAALSLARLHQVAAEVDLPAGVTLTIVDASGTILVRYPEPRRWVGMSMPYAPIVRAMVTQGEGMTEAGGLDGVPRLYTFTQVGDSLKSGLFLGIGISRAAVTAEADRHLLRHLAGLGLVGLLALGAAWVGAGRIAASLETGQRGLQALRDRVNDLLAQRAHEVALLNQLSGLLQACFTVEEAAGVVSRLVGHCFPGEGGALLVVDASRSLVERVAVWGPESAPGRPLFAPDECWALRRGQSYGVEDTTSGLVCPHLGAPLPRAYLCVPLVAQGEAMGVLHLHGASADPSEPGAVPTFLSETKQRLAATVAEQVALALANLRLRETLRIQSIRDPLTGLFNRRYMEETLTRELARGERTRQPVAVLVLDVDHFKRFNDGYGHDAGDAVLGALGSLLRANVRTGDVACRHGGEEFVLILPGASVEEARRRASELREAAGELSVSYQGRPLGPVTFSMGVAAYPDHGSTGEALLRAADAALYRAKHEGRDQVVVAG